MTDAGRPETGSKIPDRFFGRFILERSENFDEFLASKGVNWLLRKMIQFTSVTKVIEQSQQPGKYNLENLSSKKTTKYHDWELGKPFEGDGLDGKRHSITFNYLDDALTEKHVRLDEPGDKGETYSYTVDNENKLILKMENNGIVCRRWFKKEEQPQQ